LDPQHLEAYVGDDAGFERPRVRILPDGRMSATDAAVYLGRQPGTLATWRCYKVGPEWVTLNGRVFYFKATLDRYIAENRGLGLKTLSEKAIERRRRRARAGIADKAADNVNRPGRNTRSKRAAAAPGAPEIVAAASRE
jgi:hypothetical protein